MIESPQPQEKQKPFIDNIWTFLISTALIGPFALPLLWRNPKYSKHTKWIVTLLVLALTGFLIWFSGYVAVETVNHITNLEQP